MINVKTGRIDELGRVVIPMACRRLLSINDGDLLEVTVDDQAGKRMVIIKKYQPRCVFCGEIAEDGIPLNNRFICPKCRDEVSQS